MTQGVWSIHERSLNINILELKVITLGLFHLQETVQGYHVLVQTDNMTAKAYIQYIQTGGTRDRNLHKEASQVMK